MIEVDENKDSILALSGIERHNALLPVSEIEFKLKYKENCLNCPEYGRNLACPPYSPSFDEFAGEQKMAKIICLRTSLHLYSHLPEKERPRAAYDKMTLLLTDILVEERAKGYRVAGAGACKACRECPFEKEGICIKPESQLFSLESLGVNLSALIDRCFDFSLEWNKERYAARHICAVGGVLY